MKTLYKRIVWMVTIILFLWTLLTLWAESEGREKIKYWGDPSSVQQALIVYDPDPFFNLDEQVCTAFGEELADNNWYVTIASVAAATKLTNISYDLHVFCANTYNWAPDWSISRYIKLQQKLVHKNVIAITLGAGSTVRSKRILETMLRDQGANLVASETFWLWRPNDQNRLKENNVKVALEMAGNWGDEIALKLK